LGDNVPDSADDVQTLAGVNLTRLADDCLPGDPLAPYQARIRQWATEYLVAPHADLGRTGPVCPYSAASIRNETFWVGCADAADLTVDDVEKITADVIPVFYDLSPVDGPDAVVKAILILFPQITDYGIIDQAQRRLKEKSIPAGLMIGQFYPGCDEPGVRNSAFRPLQSPIPLLAIRYMVGSDFPFLAPQSRWVEEYLKKFAPAVPPTVRTTIAARF
jgi:hypothetical protein